MLQCVHLADLQPDARPELEGAAAGSGFRVAEHHPDLLTYLVDEHRRRVRAAERAGQLPKSLGHQSRLQADVRIAHLAFDLRPRHEGGDGIDHHHIDGAAADQAVHYLESFLRGPGLRDQKVVDANAHVPGVLGIDRMFGIYERRRAAKSLSFGDDLESQGGLA